MSEPGAAESEADADAGRRIANEARERVRFEEEALQLADQVYRVARRHAFSAPYGRLLGWPGE